MCSRTEEINTFCYDQMTMRDKKSLIVICVRKAKNRVNSLLLEI